MARAVSPTHIVSPGPVPSEQRNVPERYGHGDCCFACVAKDEQESADPLRLTPGVPAP